MNEEDKGVDEDVDEGPAVGKDCEIKTQVDKFLCFFLFLLFFYMNIFLAFHLI